MLADVRAIISEQLGTEIEKVCVCVCVRARALVRGGVAQANGCLASTLNSITRQHIGVIQLDESRPD